MKMLNIYISTGVAIGLLLQLPFVCPKYPYPYNDNDYPCDDALTPPRIQSYHIHVVFNGSDYNETLGALRIRSQFIDYYNNHISKIIHPNINNNNEKNNNDKTRDMPTCPFSHPNGYNPNYNTICQFLFNTTINDFPLSESLIFSASNYAFYIPNNDNNNNNNNNNSILYDLTQEWFRQYTQHTVYSNYKSISYIIHTNTGCENNDHSKWSILNYDYNFNKVNKKALFCCHYGPPPMCYCNVTQYLYINNNENGINKNNSCSSDDNNISNQLCLSVNYGLGNSSDDSNQLTLRNCENDTEYDDAYWRETLYTWQFPQLENFGNTGYNTYQCIGIISDQEMNDNVCQIGSKVGIIDCYQENLETNLFEFDYTMNKIRAFNCTNENLCLSIKSPASLTQLQCQNNNQPIEWILDNCQNAIQFERILHL